MAKQLFEVTKTYYVMAEDEQEANDFKPELDGCDSEAFPAESVNATWWDSLPFGGDDDRTCGQIITEKKAAAKEVKTDG